MGIKVIWNYLNTKYWRKLICKSRKSELVILLRKWNKELFEISKIYGKFCVRFLKSTVLSKFGKHFV